MKDKLFEKQCFLLQVNFSHLLSHLINNSVFTLIYHFKKNTKAQNLAQGLDMNLFNYRN